MSASEQPGADRSAVAQPRASDTDRIQLAQVLAYAAEQGRLDLNDYEDRLAKAYAAQTYRDLDSLASDLPGSAVNTRRGGACNPAPSTLLLALLSGFERRGRWNVPRKLTTFTFFGSGVIDLRYADFTSPDVNIRAYSIMGAQTILLPPEVNVEVEGHSVMGNFDHDLSTTGTPGAPKVKISGFSLWGRVGIKRKSRKAPKAKS